MIMTFGEGVIFASLMIIAIAIMKTGDRIVEAIRARGQPEPWVKTYSGGKPNYTEPKEWFGLTDDEMLDIYGQNHEGKKYNLGRLVQAKLMEKNT